MKKLIIGLFLLLATAAHAQKIGGVSGGTSGITSGTTTCTSCPANSVANSDGAVVNFSTTLPSGLAATNMALTTPTLGVASGTSIAVGGATIGTNALAVTGNADVKGELVLHGPAVTSYASVNIYDSAPNRAIIFGGQGGAGGTGGLSWYSNYTIGWTGTTTGDVTAAKDNVLSRNAAGILQFGTNAANAAGSWLATNGTLSGLLSLTGSQGFVWANGNGSARLKSSTQALQLGSLTYITWTQSSDSNDTPDITLSRNAAGIVQFGTTTNNALGSWLAVNGTLSGALDTTGTVRASHGFTVATLPAGTVGMMAYVTDAIACTFLTTVTGGGAIVCPVFFDGTTWKGS